MALTVITGPPASGKTTWVAERAQAGDIVIDYDTLAVALGGPGTDSHDHPRTLRDITFRARNAAIQEALQHCAKIDVYIIHAIPNADAMTRYHQYGARIVTIDPGRDVVTERIRAMRPPGALVVAGRWYAQRPTTRARDTSARDTTASRAW